MGIMWAIASNLVGRYPRLRRTVQRVMGLTDPPEHLFDCFDGGQTCVYCYRPKTLTVMLQPCRANVFAKRAPVRFES
jgi:hypothetical protein